MDNKNKPYLTIEQQMKLLESRKLNISDRDKLYNFIRVYNYQQLINGYNDPFFIHFDRNTNIYDSTACSCAIIELFNFDRNISSKILSNIQNIERQFSTFLCNVISKHMLKKGKDDGKILDKNFNLSLIFSKRKTETKESFYELIKKQCFITKNIKLTTYLKSIKIMKKYQFEFCVVHEHSEI